MNIQNLILKCHVQLEESFMNVYVEDGFDLGILRSSIKRIYITSDSTYKKKYLNKVMNKKFQDLSKYQQNDLLRLIQKTKYLFDKTDPIDFELKEDAKPVFSKQYPIQMYRMKFVEISIPSYFIGGYIEIK